MPRRRKRELMDLQQYKEYLELHRDEFLEELKAFCAQPSVAATGEGIAEMANLTRETLQSLGAEVQMLEVGPGEPPVVYGSLGEGDKTLLIYNHYDVQPADPLHLWTSPPFEPTVRDGKIFARGVSDNKGHIMMRVQAIRAWQEVVGPLPFKVNWFIEGEEETGSPNLEPFCMANAELLHADGCLWEMGNLDNEGRPVLTLGAKGLLYVELSVQALNADQHSALGTIAPNAAWRLTWALSTLKAPDETIQIEGFYDDVVPPTEAELEVLGSVPFNEEAMMVSLGIREWVSGVSGFDALKKHILEPTCTICGIESGYTGAGQKTVLPAEAKAKIGFRLVPKMEPQKIAALLRTHLDKHGFSDVKVAVLGAEHPGKASPNADIVRAALMAARKTFPAVEPVIYPNSPGTGPVWPIAIAHGTPMVGFGTSYEGARLHAPDENLRLEDYYKGIEMMGRFIEMFALGV